MDVSVDVLVDVDGFKRMQGTTPSYADFNLKSEIWNRESAIICPLLFLPAISMIYPFDIANQR